MPFANYGITTHPGMPRRGKGRPKLPREKRKKVMVCALLTHDERRAVKKAAEAQDLSVSAWLRELIQRRLGRN